MYKFIWELISGATGSSGEQGREERDTHSQQVTVPGSRGLIQLGSLVGEEAEVIILQLRSVVG